MTKTEREAAENKLKSLYCILATLPGIPTVFYGDEAGLEGYSDPFNRMPYPWGKESKELISHYKHIGEIRRKNSVYAIGGFELLYLSEDVFAFKRFDRKNTLITVYNNSCYDFSVDFHSGATDLISNVSAFNFNIKSKCARIYKTSNKDKVVITKII